METKDNYLSTFSYWIFRIVQIFLKLNFPLQRIKFSTMMNFSMKMAHEWIFGHNKKFPFPKWDICDRIINVRFLSIFTPSLFFTSDRKILMGFSTKAWFTVLCWIFQETKINLTNKNIKNSFGLFHVFKKSFCVYFGILSSSICSS